MGQACEEHAQLRRQTCAWAATNPAIRAFLLFAGRDPKKTLGKATSEGKSVEVWAVLALALMLDVRIVVIPASSVNQELVRTINSQVNEQANAGVKRLAGQLAYMSAANFVHHFGVFRNDETRICTM
eukprot:gnl/Spiro4/10622_TR5679_c0_g1_i1.p2 gnl/Spiro4/10622_TR5679_c0_g1~~gnl/Spiro4/10622_TR5679_c0_g1_i1.p2  ORF type:complete len:127 (+),score=16.74 gnl/Spiro4/10622_TR5679_c0_g1_i1:162-542(+)